MLNRRLLVLSALATLLAVPLTAGAQTTPSTKTHKVVFQVSDADPAKWNLALNNARNVQKDLGKDAVDVEIVAYGPGIGMLKLDSTAANRIGEAMGAGVSVVACENTMRNQKLTHDDMLPKISFVKAGVVQIMARQQQGWAYVRP